MTIKRSLMVEIPQSRLATLNSLRFRSTHPTSQAPLPMTSAMARTRTTFSGRESRLLWTWRERSSRSLSHESKPPMTWSSQCSLQEVKAGEARLTAETSTFSPKYSSTAEVVQLHYWIGSSNSSLSQKEINVLMILTLMLIIGRCVKTTGKRLKLIFNLST